jgi:hypothetical protein
MSSIEKILATAPTTKEWEKEYQKNPRISLKSDSQALIKEHVASNGPRMLAGKRVLIVVYCTGTGNG